MNAQQPSREWLYRKLITEEMSQRSIAELIDRSQGYIIDELKINKGE